MDAELKAKWIAALRSGDYKQGRGFLVNREQEHCCLGVLCAIKGVPYDSTGIGYDAVREALAGADYWDLVKLNDDLEQPFSVIADYIEREL